ncbi:acetylcholine receptor subunit beta [Aplysia californica]|uniref:Acetylcholine receptor subunit beta n=1 Tax=Aplysia californica TaxID=6500 RepID=A0ABM1A4V4_APLCA|nr:acetylcholine receptor subunit beta [Aplysia californica]
MMRLLLLLPLLTSSLQISMCAWYDTHSQLHRDLFSNYSRHIRPSVNGEPTQVSLILFPMTLSSLDEKTQTLSMKILFSLSWPDTKLAWDKASYDGINETFYRQESLWVPPITVFNSISQVSQWGHDDQFLSVLSYGIVIWTITASLHTECSIQVTYYPFDSQDCQIVVNFPPFPTLDLVLNPDPKNPVQTVYYTPSGSWDLVGTYMNDYYSGSTTHQFHTLIYGLKFRRLTRFYILNTIMPVLFLSVTASAVFYLPAEAGEKMGMSITVLLAYAVYLSIIAENLPQTSKQVCYLQVYLTTLLGITSFGVLVSVVVLRIHHRSPEVPVGLKTAAIVRKIRQYTCLTKSSMICNSYSSRIHPDPQHMSDEVPLEKEKVSTDQKQAPPDFDGDEHFKKNPISLDDLKGNVEDVTWPCVAETMDRVFFILFTCTIALLTVTLLPYIAIAGSLS